MPLPYEGESPEAYVRRFETQLRVNLYKIEEDFAKKSRRTFRMSQVLMVVFTFFYAGMIGWELTKDEPSLWMLALNAFCWASVVACWVPVLLQSHRNLQEAKAEMDRLSSPLIKPE